MSNDLSVIVNAQRDRFLAVTVDNRIKFEREAQFAMQAMNANDYLRDIAIKNPVSLQAAIINVSAIGISLNPASKLAYLVPSDNKVCLDISYMGLLSLAQQCGAIQWGQAAIVRANDEFTLNGVDREPTHKFNPFATDRGDIVGVYVVVKTDTGDYLTHAMPISEVFKIRDRSATFKAGKSSPWKSDEQEMIKKTCVKQAAKYWPRRDRLDQATHYLNTDGGEGIPLDNGTMQEEAVKALIDAIEATTTMEAAKAAWQAALKECQETKDMEAYELIKAKTADHYRFIQSTVVKEVAA